MTVAYVGRPYSKFLEWLEENGHTVIAFPDKADPARFPDFVSQIIPLDFESKERFLSELNGRELSIDAIIAVHENAVLQKAWLAEHLGLPGPSETTAHIATDKSLMRKAFSLHCPQYSPEYSKVSQWEEVEAFARTHSFPLILKPTSLFKSLFVTKNNSLEELKRNYTDAIHHLAEIFEKELVYRNQEMVIEEYLDGPSFSVEVFADAAGNVVSGPEPVDLVMGRDLGINDNCNYLRSLPSRVSAEQQRELMTAAEAAAQAVGLTSSPAHVELVYTAHGPKIIELGARTGGYRSKMYDMAFGIDLFQAQLDVARGNLPKLVPEHREHCWVYELFAFETGKFVGIEGREGLEKFPACIYVSVKRKPGEMVGLSRDGYRAAAVVILRTTRQDELLDADQFLRDSVRVLSEV